MTSHRFQSLLVVATPVVFCLACSSNTSETTGSGAGRSAGGAASGGAGASGTGRVAGSTGTGTSGGSASSGVGASSSASASGGRGSGGTGGGGSSGGAGASGGGVSSSGGASSSAGVSSSASASTGGGNTGGSSSVDRTSSGGSSGKGGAAGSAGGAGGTTGTGGTGGTTGTGGIQACPVLPGAPSGTPPLPTAAQLSYQRTELNAFIHYGLATYDGSEQANPSDPPSMFNPSNLNATTVGKWVTSLKEAGFRQATLVAKHSVGFALWPSKYTDYSVKSSPWMNGQGDVVKLFSEAMYANEMRPAYYLAPYDQKYPSSKADYGTYFKNQALELLGYGPAYELWFDGAFSNTYAGVDWKPIFSAIRQAQPNLLIWSGPEIARTGAIPDLQWIGNESGMASRTTSSLDTKMCGDQKTYCPYECDTSSHGSWFWHSDSDIISFSTLQRMYFQTVGMNCTFMFNVPPNKTGEFGQADLNLLKQFGQWYAALYKTNLAKGQEVTADSTWDKAGFEASKVVDDDICTYWAAASGKKAGRLEVLLPSSTTVNLISVREAIELSERVTKYHVEVKQNGTWSTSPSDKSGVRIQGTVIGNRQLWQLDGVKADAIALVIESAKDVPAIAEFGVY